MSTKIATCAVIAGVALATPSTLSPANIARIDTTADALLATVFEEIVQGQEKPVRFLETPVFDYAA